MTWPIITTVLIFKSHVNSRTLADTVRQINLNNLLLVKYYNDYLDMQSCVRVGIGVTFFWVGKAFCNALCFKYTNFQQKISSDTNCGTSETSYCSNFTTMEFLRRSTACVGWNFLLKIVICRAKGITKKFPNLEECDPNSDPHTALHIKVVIVVLY